MHLSPTILAFHHVKSAYQLPPEAIAALVGAGGGGLVQLLRKMTQSKRDEEENGSPSVLAGMLGGGLLGGGLGAGYQYLNRQQGNPAFQSGATINPPAGTLSGLPGAALPQLPVTRGVGGAGPAAQAVLGAGLPAPGTLSGPLKPPGFDMNALSLPGAGPAAQAVMNADLPGPGSLMQAPTLGASGPDITAGVVGGQNPLRTLPGAGVRAPASFPLSAGMGDWQYPQQAPPQSFLSRIGGLLGGAKNTFDTTKAILPHVPTMLGNAAGEVASDVGGAVADAGKGYLNYVTSPYRLGGQAIGAAGDWAGDKVDGAVNSMVANTGMSLAELAAAYNQATQPPKPPGRIPLRGGLAPAN